MQPRTSMIEAQARLYIQNYIKNMPPEQKLQTYYDFYKDLPKQGSFDWEQNRRVGASEAAGILGECKYTNKFKVACRLLKLDKFEKNLITQWGNIFEPVAKLYLSNYIKIYEFGSLPGFGNPVLTSCSPDGIFLYNEFLKIDDAPEHNTPCLLEIKCPFNRHISEIPTYYLPQLYMGMNTVCFTQTAMFCEFIFRACSIQDFNFGQSIRSENQYSPDCVPEAIGFIVLYSRKPYEAESITIESEHDLQEILQSTEPDLFKLGKINRLLGDLLDIEKISICKKYFSLDVLSEYFRKKIIDWNYCDFGATENICYKFTENFSDILNTESYYYSPLLTEHLSDWDCKTWMQQQISLAPTENIIGILPYKLFEKKIRFVPNIYYKEQIIKIVEFAKKINELKINFESCSKSEIKSKLQEIYL